MKLKLYSNSKYAIIRSSILFIILLLLIYVMRPIIFSYSTYHKSEINSLLAYHDYDPDFIKEVSIQDLSVYPEYIHNLYYNYIYPGIDGMYMPKHKKLLLLTKDDNKSTTLFHEYLHYLYEKENLNDMELRNIMKVIIGSSETNTDLLYMHISLVKDYNLKIGMTEFISHNYEVYSTSCKEERDILTDTLLSYNLLPKTIYCNNTIQ